MDDIRIADDGRDLEGDLTPAQAYHRFLGPAMFAPWASLLLDMAAPRAGTHALDLACGTGIVTHRLASRLGERGRIVGVDINPDMLDVARAASEPSGSPAAPIDWRTADAISIPAEDNSFDLIVCQQGLQFFPDKSAAANEMRRVLGDGGYAAVAVWEGLDRHTVFRALFEAEARHVGANVADLAVPFSLSDPAYLKQVFTDAGFSRVEVTSHHLDARFDDSERFIELAVASAAAVIPELAHQSEEDQQALLAAVKRDAGVVVDSYRKGDGLEFPMYANIAMAHT